MRWLILVTPVKALSGLFGADSPFGYVDQNLTPCLLVHEQIV